MNRIFYIRRDILICSIRATLVFLYSVTDKGRGGGQKLGQRHLISLKLCIKMMTVRSVK